MAKAQPKNFFAGLQRRLIYSPEGSRLAIPLLIAALVGALIGLMIVAFIELTELSHSVFFGLGSKVLSPMQHFYILFIPAIGGLICGLIKQIDRRESTGMGVAEVMKAMTLKKGVISFRAFLYKFFTSAVSIGSGASTGREGPAVLMGASIGSTLARLFKLSEIRVKNLVACGAAAGIAAVFNAPITGVMFALEIILKDFRAVALSTVVVSAVAASIVSRTFLGEAPAFSAPVYTLHSPWEIGLYAGLGLAAAIVAVFFTRVFDRVDSSWERLRIPFWIKPCLGGLVVGAMALLFPQVLGMGFDTISNALSGHPDLWFFLGLMVFKIFATSVSLGSGSSGGVFAPALFVGACLGSAYGDFFGGHVNFPMASPGAYALVGMASVFAGVFHSPVTAIMLVFEMTRDYQIILPLMGAAVIATSAAQVLHPVSLEHMKLKRQGVDLAHLDEVRVLRHVKVSDALSQEFEKVLQSAPASGLYEKMAVSPEKIFLVVNKQDELCGALPREIMQALLFEKNAPFLLADDVAAPCTIRCFPEDSLNEAAEAMHQGHLTFVPVMDRQNPRRVIGVLRADDVFKAYTQLSQKHDDLLREERHRLESADGMLHCHFVIPQKAAIAAKTIRDLHLPEGVVLTCVERRRKLMAPSGSFELKDRDKIWAVMLPSSQPLFKAWLQEHGLDKNIFFD